MISNITDPLTIGDLACLNGTSYHRQIHNFRQRTTVHIEKWWNLNVLMTQ